MYTARVIEQLNNGKYLRIGIFQGEQQIGEYRRNYSSFFHTFCPFTLNGKDYALYSRDYTCTRIMELPSCQDIGGEEPESFGFCPTDYYVPSYYEVTYPPDYLPDPIWVVDEPPKESRDKGVITRPYGSFPFGFVAGCIWGDDSSWKIEYFDLSEADKGILKRDNRFGYIHLPGGMRLSEAIDLDNLSTRYHEIRIAHTDDFNLDTGKKDE